MKNDEAACEVICVEVPESLYFVGDYDECADDEVEEQRIEDVANVMGKLKGELVLKTYKMEFPITISWIDSGGECVERERLHLSTIEGGIQEITREEVLSDDLKSGTAIVKAANGEAPLFVTLEDSVGTVKKFRIQFGEYQPHAEPQ